MKLHLSIVIILICVYGYTMIEMSPELKKNVLKFGYGINYKYEGTLSLSFDRFYVVTKFELPGIEALKWKTISHNSDCKYLDDAKSRKDYPIELIKDMEIYCVKIVPHVAYYKKQVDYYNWTAYEIITNELALILPTIPKQERQRRGIITSLITVFYQFSIQRCM